MKIHLFLIWALSLPQIAKYHFKAMRELEKIQWKASRFVELDFTSRQQGAMTAMLKDLVMTSIKALAPEGLKGRRGSLFGGISFSERGSL